MAKQVQDKKVWITVALNKQGEIIHAVHKRKKIRPTKKTKKHKRLSRYSLGHRHGNGHGSDPCCFWDDAANEEVCFC